MNFPRGQWVWCSYLPKNPTVMVAQAIEGKVDGVHFLRFHNATAKAYCNGFESYAAELTKAGIAWGVWAQVGPGDIEQATKVANEAQSVGASCLHYGCEVEWKGNTIQADHLVQAAKSQYWGPIGVSNFGLYEAMQGWPYEQFAALDFAIPQAYDMKETLGDNYQARVLKGWASAYDFVSVGLSATKNSQVFAVDYDETPENAQGVTWWEWSRFSADDWLELSSLPTKDGFTLPDPTPQEQPGEQEPNLLVPALAGLGVLAFMSRGKS